MEGWDVQICVGSAQIHSDEVKGQTSNQLGCSIRIIQLKDASEEEKYI
jgi:hypothetical protein